jgi:uncharacterized membrane protein YqjE
LLTSLRQLLVTFMGMLHTRLSLAGVELEEEWQRLIGLLLGMVGPLVFGLVGLLMLTLILVLAALPQLRRPVPRYALLGRGSALMVWQVYGWLKKKEGKSPDAAAGPALPPD